MNRTVSIVMAGYNEEDSVLDSVKRVWEAFSGSGMEFELLLIDDASLDNTLSLMRECEKQYDNVTVYPNYANLNFGASVLRGLFAAKNEYVIYNAFDLPVSPEDMVSVVKGIQDEDVIVLERLDYKTTKWRRVTSDVNRLLLKILYPRLTRGTPVLNYVQVFRRECMDVVKPWARSPIFVWPEMVFRAKLNDLKLKNIPVKCQVENVRKGSFGHPHDIMWGMYEMLRFRIRAWGNKRKGGIIK